MLGLAYQTPPEWADRVLAQPAELLLDHYFCELKAAAMAQRTLNSHSHRHPKLKPLMNALAEEELDHAQQVQRRLQEYPPISAPKGGNPYVRGLRQLAHASGHGSFLDHLLICSLIEARSAERFRLLADRARGSSLGGFYEDLYASEVNHYILFVKLGAECCGVDRTVARLRELRAGEAELIRALPPGPRIHGGPDVSVPRGGGSNCAETRRT